MRFRFTLSHRITAQRHLTAQTHATVLADGLAGCLGSWVSCFLVLVFVFYETASYVDQDGLEITEILLPLPSSADF